MRKKKKKKEKMRINIYNMEVVFSIILEDITIMIIIELHSNFIKHYFHSFINIVHHFS